jgi:peroxiredoxin-like protein
MQPLPHHYEVKVTASEKGPAEIMSHELMTLRSAPPRQYEGPGDLWSPETLLVAAAADCLVLTFRAIAQVSKLQWSNITCDADGTVDRAQGAIRFTAIRLHARVVLPAGADHEKAYRVLEKAEKACLVGNSLKCEPMIESEVTSEVESLAPSA